MTDDEAAIWELVTETIHPLRRPDAPRISTKADDPTLKQAPRQVQPDPPAPVHKPQWQRLVTTGVPRPAKPTPSPNAPFDRKHAKRIAAGRIEIEGRLDLHGLRESEAHGRLRGFLRQAQSQGKRTVLVITGKGQASDDAHMPFDFGADRMTRGVLKRNVPHWLSAPDLSAIVVAFTPAHARHGGDGALYVHLRRPRD